MRVELFRLLISDANRCTFHARLRSPPAQGQTRVDLISDVLPFGRLWYGEPNAVSNAVDYAKFRSRSHDAVIRVYDEAGNVIETHEHAGDFKESSSNPVPQCQLRRPRRDCFFATIKGNKAGAEPAAYPVVVLDDRQETLPKRHHA